MAGSTPIYVDQGGTNMVVDTGATLTVRGTLDTAGGGSITVADGSITTAKLASNAVTKVKTGMFISSTQTGTQTMIAHGLGVNPTAANVIVAPISTAGTDTPGVYAVAIATDATNVSITVTGGALQYRVMAWAP